MNFLPAHATRPLDGYNSLTDDYLLDFFNNTRIRRHLQNMGLITKCGKVIDESTYQTNLAIRNMKDFQRTKKSQYLAKRKLESKLSHEASVRDKLIQIQNFETVTRIRHAREIIKRSSARPARG